MYTTLVVLNDGETYSTISGASLVVVDQDTLKRIENGESLKDVSVILEIGLTQYRQPQELSDESQ